MTVDFAFTREELLIQNAFSDFAEKFIEPIAADIDKNNAVPQEIFDGLAELDMFGIPFPAKYGGAEGGFKLYVLALEQVAAACGGLASIIAAHVLGTNAINYFGTEEQKQKYLPDCCRGKHIASFAFTEPSTGSDPKQITTTAVKSGNEYILNGTKRFISNGNWPGPMIVFARESTSQEVTAFIVDKFSEGYSVSEPWEKIGMHGYPLLDIYFNDVRVPAENMLGQIGQGFPILTTGICFGRVGVATTALGAILASYREAAKYAQNKMHRDKPIGKFQQIQLAVADIAATYEACRWMTYRLGYVADTFKDERQFAKEVSTTKSYVTDASVDVARTALNIHGSYGLMKDYKIERIYRDVIIGPQIEGVNNMQKIITASNVLR